MGPSGIKLSRVEFKDFVDFAVAGHIFTQTGFRVFMAILSVFRGLEIPNRPVKPRLR